MEGADPYGAALEVQCGFSVRRGCVVTGFGRPSDVPGWCGRSECRALEGSRSGYYRWIAGAEVRAARQADEDAPVAEIRDVHAEHHGNFGALRVHAELRSLGHTVNRKRVARLMRKYQMRTADRDMRRPRSRSSVTSTASAGAWAEAAQAVTTASPRASGRA
ncbi:IS3 family transposase [Streptomyces sp. NPDC058613]|uniref:IS3 family transposase n=1 Tax=Streptomyces sp. NPDC058613 TaxID=3346556 RepID=UPI003661A4F8